MEKETKILNTTARVVDEKARVLRFVGTTGAVDRDGESIDPAGWDLKHFIANPVVMFGHSYSELPVAKAVSVKSDENGLTFDIQFPTEEESGDWYKFADSVYRMSKAGFLNTTSVGFRPLAAPEVNPKADGVKDPVRTWKSQELLELSIVPVPSNPEALAASFEDGTLTDADHTFLKHILIQETADGKNVDWATELDSLISSRQKDSWQYPKLLAPLESKEALQALERIEKAIERVEQVAESFDARIKSLEVVVGDPLFDLQLVTLKSTIDNILKAKSKSLTADGGPDAGDKGDDLDALLKQLN